MILSDLFGEYLAIDYCVLKKMLPYPSEGKETEEDSGPEGSRRLCLVDASVDLAK